MHENKRCSSVSAMRLTAHLPSLPACQVAPEPHAEGGRTAKRYARSSKVGDSIRQSPADFTFALRAYHDEKAVRFCTALRESLRKLSVGRTLRVVFVTCVLLNLGKLSM